MLSKPAGHILFVWAAIAAAAPPAHATDRVIWVDLCDALHSGRKVPLPLDRDEHGSGQACHAACGLVSSRRDPNRRQA